jgi:hypothetical protein
MDSDFDVSFNGNYISAIPNITLTKRNPNEMPSINFRSLLDVILALKG